MVASLLLRSSLRFYRQHPLQLILSIVGIVLGVCIVTAVWISNSSSTRAFALSTEALYGRTTHHIVAAQGIENSIYARFIKDHPEVLAAPIIEGQVNLNTTVLTLIGLDPFAELPFERTYFQPEQISNRKDNSNTNHNSDTTKFTPRTNLDLLNSQGLLLSEITRKRLGLTNNPFLSLQAGSHSSDIELLGSFTSQNPIASDGLLIGDIALVQSILQRGNSIDRIDLIATQQQADAIKNALPATLKLNNAASRQQTMQAMTKGFQTNLTAMSLLSLLVGAFLIHNTMSFTVLQRRELFAVKRTVGISALSLFISILVEAFLISLLGSLIGVALGLALAHQLIKLTTQTINDLYFVLHVQEVLFTPSLFFGGILLGVSCSLIAASVSAWDAAKTSPIQAQQRSFTEHRTRAVLPFLASLGIVLMLLGAALATQPSQSLLLGFLSLMLIIVGFGLLVPGISFYASRLLKMSLSGLHPILSMAAGSIERNISRTGLAIAALTVAISSTFGVDVMIGSFRHSVDVWLKDTLQSDVYISAASDVTMENDNVLKPAVIQSFSALKEVESISTGLTINARTNLGEFETLVLTPHKDKRLGINIISDNAALAWDRFINNGYVLVSEPLANKYQITVGDSISLLTESRGEHAFKVSGITRDYASSHGQLTMHRNTFKRYWKNDTVSTVGIRFRPDENAANATKSIRELINKHGQSLRLQANHEIHKNSLAIFDRTFEVTRVLRWLTVGVAFVGVFSALLALNLERAKEFAVLRATGSSRRQLFTLITSQTLWMGLLAGFLALPLGWVMAKVLIHVINLRSFGWSMQSFIPEGTVMSTFLLACTAALLAGLYPAWILSRSRIAHQLRNSL